MHKLRIQETETTLPGIRGALLVRGTILEAEYQVIGHSIAMGCLDPVTISDRVSRESSQYEKTVQQAFRVADRHCF